MDRPEIEIKRHVSIARSELGSRKISSHHLQAFLGALQQKCGIKFNHVRVSRFGQSDILEYPAEMASQAIDDFDVSDMSCRTSYSADTTVELDLGSSRAGYAFKVSGEKSKVANIVNVIQDETAKWPRTNFWIVNRTGIYVIANWILGAASGFLIPTALSRDTVVNWLLAGVLSYAFVCSNFIIFNGSKYNPYIWFYKPSGRIEARSKVTFRLLAGVPLAIVLGVLGNFGYAALTR
jgi:hypothetical protein